MRFCELDALNHVNNVEYLRWFETIRVRYVQDYGLTSYGVDDPQLVVRRQTADYFQPMFQDDTYILTTRTRLIKASSLIMEYAIHSGGALKAIGEAVVVSLEQDGKTRRAHYPKARAEIIARDGAEEA
ncbi:MAG: acyl-CoA thioesterase [Silicimonas sp.]|nr:acyl-CoA thioesterase [Silicimonas sp.]